MSFAQLDCQLTTHLLFLHLVAASVEIATDLQFVYLHCSTSLLQSGPTNNPRHVLTVVSETDRIGVKLRH